MVLSKLGNVRASGIVVSNGMLFMSDCMEIHQLFIRGGRYRSGSRDSVAGLATCCGLDVPGVRIPVG